MDFVFKFNFHISFMHAFFIMFLYAFYRGETTAAWVERKSKSLFILPGSENLLYTPLVRRAHTVYSLRRESL